MLTVLIAPAKPKLTAAQKRAALKAEEAKFVDEDSESEEASTSTASRKRSAPKRKKAEELAEKAAAAQGTESEKREKQLEESKKIVLSEDAALPTAIKVRGGVF